MTPDFLQDAVDHPYFQQYSHIITGMIRLQWMQTADIYNMYDDGTRVENIKSIFIHYSNTAVTEWSYEISKTVVDASPF